MKYDQHGQGFTDSKELCEFLYKNPDLDISNFLLIDADSFNTSVASLHADMQLLKPYEALNIGINEFDAKNQANWRMPQEYKDMDIAEWLLSQCKEDYELQRVGHELLLYQERNLFNLLRYLKYLVDTLRKHSVVWGVGRGSSVSSYVLFLIGVHKINSIYYELSVEEFLR